MGARGFARRGSEEGASRAAPLDRIGLGVIDDGFQHGDSLGLGGLQAAVVDQIEEGRRGGEAGLGGGISEEVENDLEGDIKLEGDGGRVDGCSAGALSGEEGREEIVLQTGVQVGVGEDLVVGGGVGLRVGLGVRWGVRLGF